MWVSDYSQITLEIVLVADSYTKILGLCVTLGRLEGGSSSSVSSSLAPAHTPSRTLLARDSENFDMQFGRLNGIAFEIVLAADLFQILRICASEASSSGPSSSGISSSGISTSALILPQCRGTNSSHNKCTGRSDNCKPRRHY